MMTQIVIFVALLCVLVGHVSSEVFGETHGEDCSHRIRALISDVAEPVPDSALSASSTWDGNTTTWGPRCGRLGVPKPPHCVNFCWHSEATDEENSWIQVRLGSEHQIHAVATMGRTPNQLVVGRCCEQWVISYRMATVAGQSVNFYRAPGGTSPRLFDGNTDHRDIVMNDMTPPMVGQIIRLYPVDFHHRICIRWELYGFPSSQV